MDVRCSEFMQFSLPPSLLLYVLCSMISHPLCWLYSPSVYAVGVLVMVGTKCCCSITELCYTGTTLQVLSRDLLRGRAAVIQARRGAGRVMELQTIITNYNVQRTAAASLVAAPWPRHKWICTDSDSELLKWFSLSDSCSLRAERPAAGGDNWEYSQIKTIRGRILPRCKLEEHCWHSIIPMQQCRQIEIFANFGPINTILIFDAPPSWHETLKHKIWKNEAVRPKVGNIVPCVGGGGGRWWLEGGSSSSVSPLSHWSRSRVEMVKLLHFPSSQPTTSSSNIGGFNYFKLLLNVCFHFVVEIHHENDLFLHISKLSIYRNDIPKMMVTKLEW